MSVPLPLSIYVVYHPEAQDSRALAEALFGWFRLDGDDGDDSEAGLSIWLRARLSDGPEPVLAPAIHRSGAELNVTVLLVDDHMVADRRWRQALEGLLPAADDLLVLPVAVDYSLYRLGFLYGRLNPIRIGDPHKTPLPERARLLRRATTEAIIRQLRKKHETTEQTREQPKPLEVFLSHAKADGIEIAEAIRDNLAGLSQMRAWYDANELPPGYGWESPMTEAAKQNAAVLLSVVTDAYPTRHWCRQEVNLARKPRRWMATASQDVQVWTVQPVVAVHRPGARWSRSMAQLAQVPHVAWAERAKQVGKRVADVVDRLLLETLLVTFYRRFAQLLATDQTLIEGVREREVGLALITWVPDPWTIVHLVHQAREAFPGRSKLVIAHPGHGLRSAEQRELSELLAVIPGGESVRLISQEQLRSGLGLDAPPPGRALEVALSGGGGPQDLEPDGAGPQHIDDLFNRLARRLLQRGCTLLYGGTLDDSKRNLTRALIETARGWESGRDSSKKTRAADLESPPFFNYSPWPRYRKISLAQRAELTGICTFIAVDPPESRQLPSEVDIEHNREHARLLADALSEMRRQVSQRAALRIVIGGKLYDWHGWLPGIAEEVLYTLEEGGLPLVLGSVGGCANVLAAYLRERSAPWPEALTFDIARDQARFAFLLGDEPERREQARERFDRLHTAVEGFRTQLHGEADWPHPIPVNKVRELLEIRGAASTLNLVQAALDDWVDDWE